MRTAVELAVQHEDVRLEYQASLSSQQEIENRFAMAMGDMLIDGYWSNTDYAPGQEELLYREACEVMAQLSKPTVTYSASIQNLSCVNGYEQERFEVGQLLHIWDEALSLNDQAYVSKLVERPDTPEKDSVTITNDLTSISGVSLDNIISQITGIAETVNNRKALYDRAKAIGSDGSIPAQNLEGMIDVLKTRLSSSVSNWYTDADGNLILESVNGTSAMKLCGEGFMIASARTDDGAWDWRTFGTGEGFSADMLITGFLSADRIRAGSITANKLAADVGETLDLSSNVGMQYNTQRLMRGTNMNLNKQSLAILEDLLQKDCSNITMDDLKSMLNNELEKPAKLINSRLVHVLLDLLEPTSIRGMQTDLSFSELADMIESDIAMRTFVNSDGDSYQFETVCDDIAFLMVEQYEKSGRSNPFEIKLIRDTAKKGEAALYIVIATLFQNTLDDTILGAVEGACDFLLVADDLIDGMTGEDLEIQAELADLHMNTIEQLIHYAEMGKCANVNELKKHAFTAKKRKDHIDLMYRTKGM